MVIVMKIFGAFSLIELMVVIAIVAILAAIWGIGSFLFILLGFVLGMALLILTH